MENFWYVSIMTFKKIDCLFLEFKFTLKHWKIKKKNHDLKSGQEVQALPRWLIGKDSAYQCRRSRRHRWDCIKIHWERKWQPTPVFLPGKSHHRGVWQSTVHRVSKSQTWLSTQACQKSNDHLLVSISRWLCLWSTSQRQVSPYVPLAPQGSKVYKVRDSNVYFLYLPFCT